jgi:hypothetical protein
VIDEAGFRELLIARGLGEHAGRIVAAVRPGWVLEPDLLADPSPSGVSKVGGDPDLASGEAWPLSPAGGAYTFLAQIDCSSLPALPEMWGDPNPWAHHGALVRIFADLLYAPGEPCAAAVLSVERHTTLGRVSRQATSYDQNRDAGYAEVGERFRRSFIREQDYSYRAAQPHHLLGDASSIQDDVRVTPTWAVDDGDWARQWRPIERLGSARHGEPCWDFTGTIGLAFRFATVARFTCLRLLMTSWSVGSIGSSATSQAASRGSRDVIPRRSRSVRSRTS